MAHASESRPPPLPRADATIDLGPADLIPAPELAREELVIVDPWYVLPSQVVVRPRRRSAAVAAAALALWSVARVLVGRAVVALRAIGAASLPVLRTAGRGLLSGASAARALLAALIGRGRAAGPCARRWLAAARSRIEGDPGRRTLQLQRGLPVGLRGLLARDRAVLQQVQRRLACDGSPPAGVLLGHVCGRVVLVIDLEPGPLDQATLDEMPDTIVSPAPAKLETAAA